MIDPTDNYVRQQLDFFASLGDVEALVAADGRRFSYSELHDRIVNTAAWLWGQGMRPGMTICMLVGNPAESFFAQYGAHLLGCRTAFMTRTSPTAFFGQLLREVSADAFIYEMAVASELGPQLVREHGVSLPVFCIGAGGLGPDLTDPAEVGALPFDLDEITVEPEAIFQTSGTTGVAKLVRHGQRFFRGIGRVADFYRPDDGRSIRHLLLSGTWHAGGQAGALMTWSSGGTLVVNFGLDNSIFLATVERERPTSTMVAPSMLYELLDDERLASTDVSSLYSVTISASAATPARLKQAKEIFGTALNVVYGMCEIPIMAAITQVGQDETRPQLLTSCGRPWENTRIEIRDFDGSVLPAEDVGDIWVASDLTAKDYFGNAEVTASSFVDGWLRTGDAGRFDAEGNLYIVDRISDMINVGGNKVFSRPVEDALGEHPAVRQAAVIGVPDEFLGLAVHAYVIADPDASVTGEELRSFVVDRLNDLWAPREVEFVDSFPLTEFGKVDKKVLRARYQDRTTAPTQPAHG